MTRDPLRGWRVPGPPAELGERIAAIVPSSPPVPSRLDRLWALWYAGLGILAVLLLAHLAVDRLDRSPALALAPRPGLERWAGPLIPRDEMAARVARALAQEGG